MWTDEAYTYAKQEKNVIKTHLCEFAFQNSYIDVAEWGPLSCTDMPILFQDTCLNLGVPFKREEKMFY